MNYNEIRNVTGIYDDDELNAACECERKELLAERIANKIVSSHGFCKGLYNGDVFKFDKVKKVLRDFGFKYEILTMKTSAMYFGTRKQVTRFAFIP